MVNLWKRSQNINHISNKNDFRSLLKTEAKKLIDCCTQNVWWGKSDKSGPAINFRGKNFVIWSEGWNLPIILWYRPLDLCYCFAKIVVLIWQRLESKQNQSLHQIWIVDVKSRKATRLGLVCAMTCGSRGGVLRAISKGGCETAQSSDTVTMQNCVRRQNEEGAVA